MRKILLYVTIFWATITLIACTPTAKPVDCSIEPDHKDCQSEVDCSLTPDHESCTVDCTITPDDPACENEPPYDFNVSDPSLTKDTFLVEPSRTIINEYNGINVLFQYDQVVPSFDNWEGNTEHRTHISLNGTWKFTFDEDNVGVDQQWYDPEFDDNQWDDRDVPSSWDLYDNEHFGGTGTSEFGNTNAFQDGYAWYRTSFDMDKDDLDKISTIHFLSVSYRSWIYVNGTYVEAHDSGEDAFAFDISPYLKSGENFIAVRVYRAPSAVEYFLETQDRSWQTVWNIEQMPTGGQDWWPYAGITRDVYIEVTDQLFISKTLLVTENSELTVHAVITNNSDETRTGTLKYYTDKGVTPNERPFSIEANSVGVFSHTLPIASYEEWGLTNPVLYTNVVEIVEDTGITDSLETVYGNREFTIVGNDIYLNGERIWLKGTCWHEETSDSGRSMRKDEYDFEFDMIEDLGFNFLRNSVYNRHPYAYEVSNERGILVLDEAQNMWMGDNAIDHQYNTYRLHYALQAKTVWNQHNHPSVIMWGLMNETSVWSSNFYRYTEELVNVTKQLDLSDRPTLGAFRTGHYNIPAQGLMDIIGINEYFGFHHGLDEDLGPYLDQVAAYYPDKPVLITENGAWSTLYDASRQQWHATVFKEHYGEVADRSDNFIGYTFWVLKDYKSRKGYSSNNNGISGMGVVPFDHTEEKLQSMIDMGLESFAFKLVYQQIKKTDNPMDEIGWN